MPTPTKGTIHDPSWRAFASWCRRLRLCPLPAHPWTVAAFLRWCEERPGAATVRDAVGAIAAVHMRRRLARPERDVIVRRTLAALDRQRHAADSTIPANGKSNAVRRPRAAAKRRRSLRATPKLAARRHYRNRTTH